MLKVSRVGMERSWLFDTARRLTLFAVVAVFLPSGQMAQAGVVGRATLVKDPGAGLPFLPPEAALPAGFVSYQLSIEGTNGDVIGAVDVSITGGKLHQRWSTPDLECCSPSPNGMASDGRGDSHLTAPPGSPFGLGPSETNSKTGSPLTSTPGTTEYGFGDLYGAWAILNPTTINDIAYIVVKQSDIPIIDITVKVAIPNGNVIQTLFASDFFKIPEPSAFTLVGPAMATGCGFRRRGCHCWPDQQCA